MFTPEWKRKRKQITMLVKVSVPVNMTAAQARREVKSLVNHGAGWLTYQGEEVKALAARPAPSWLQH